MFPIFLLGFSLLNIICLGCLCHGKSPFSLNHYSFAGYIILYALLQPLGDSEFSLKNQLLVFPYSFQYTSFVIYIFLVF